MFLLEIGDFLSVQFLANRHLRDGDIYYCFVF